MQGLSIKWRVAVGVTLLCIAVIILVGVLQRHFVRKDLAQLIADQQFALVSRVAENIDARLAANLEAISAHAGVFPVALLKSPARIRDYYAHRPVMMGLFDDVLLFAPNGQLIVDFPELPARRAVNAGDRAFFQQVVATRKATISEPVISKARREPIIQMAAPVLDKEGRLAAVMVGVIRLYKPNFLGNLGDTRIGKAGNMVLATKAPTAVYLAHPDKKQILQPATTPAVTRALQGYEGSAEDVSGGDVPSLFTSKSLRMAPWVLIASDPTSEVFSSIDRAERRLLVILAFVGLLVLPLVWMLTWRALNPLAELRDAIVRLRGAKTAFEPVAVTRTDEFGDLTRAFNSLMQERLAAAATQQESESHLQLIADNMPALISFLDRDLRFTFVNKRHLEWFGKAPAEFLNRSMREVFGEDNFASVRHYFEAALKGERVNFDRERSTLGKTRYTHTMLIPHLGETGEVRGIFKLTTDVSERKQVELALHELVQVDSLTGLCNRRNFNERLPVALQRNTRNGAWLALMFLDVDHFKRINDSLGHGAGDDVLLEFARRLTECVRKTDTVSRLGGDEFTIILEGLHEPGEAAAVADKILATLEPDFATRAGNCKVSASIGIALCRRDALDAAELLHQADAAVYVAKKKGRHQFHVASLPAPALKLVDTRAVVAD